MQVGREAWTLVFRFPRNTELMNSGTVAPPPLYGLNKYRIRTITSHGFHFLSWRKGEEMVGWVAFILGLLIVGIAGANQLGPIYCLPVSVAWYILLLRASKGKKQTSP
jgi:hypothetical protein